MQATTKPTTKADVEGIEKETNGVNLFNFDDVLKYQFSSATAFVCRLNCPNQTETKKQLHERISKAISNHIDDKYDYWDLVRSLAGKYFGYYNNRGGSKQHQWICSNIIAEIFKQAGLFKNNVNVYSFLPDSFSSKKLNANCCFVKGMNLEIEQKLIYH